MRRCTTLFMVALVWLAAPAHADPAKRSCGQVLLTITSYQNTGCPGGSSYYVSPSVANRMTMVFISMRGTGASEGTFDLFGADTQRDINDVLDWIVKQPWSNGSIVLAGS